MPGETASVFEGDFLSAIQQNQLFLNYQPVVDMETGRVVSAEALVRWADPERGTIFPDQFIALAEQTGLIHGMTDKVVAIALEDCRGWREKGHDIAVGVNLSSAGLADMEFADRLAELLRDADSDPSTLVLEITETSAMADVETTMDALDLLRDTGVAISIDSFGTGYSSLVQLHNMQVSELQIDRTFVMEATSDRDSRMIVAAIVNMAHSLNLKVVGVGVETEAHWNLLLGMGCDMAQGYHLSRPMPADAFAEWMDGRKEA